MASKKSCEWLHANGVLQLLLESEIGTHLIRIKSISSEANPQSEAV